MKKRMLALLLCFTMIFSMLPGQALAEGEEPSTGETQPQVTEPAATDPAEAEPEVTEPEGTEPEVTEPEATEPETGESEETESGETEETVSEDEPSAQSDLPGGTCGDNASWTFDEATGVLTISGTGDMYDYEFSPNVAPWPGYLVKKVVIEPGITRIGNYAFVNRYNMTDVSIPDTVISIGRQAFSGCSKLEVVLLPQNLTSIEWQAFLNCESLVRITVPEGVTVINEQAFSGCTSLQVATLLGNVTSIGNKAFSSCRGMTAINIPASVTSIGDGAFGSCVSLTKLSIPGSVTAIGNDAFIGCTGLTSVSLPDSITSFGYTVFKGCTGLKEVTLPGNFSSVDANTFQDCNALTRVYIPKSYTTIDSLFKSASSLADIYYGGSPADWLTVDRDNLPGTAAVFYNCTGLGDPDVPRGPCGSTCSWSFDEATGKLTIEGTYSTYTFTQTPSSAYDREVPWKDYLHQIRSVEVRGVTSIGAYAFADAINLASVSMDSVTYVGDYAFRGCASLESVSLSASLSSLRAFAFAGSGITHFSVPEHVRSLSGTFQDCSDLKAVYIPTNTSSIDSTTFQNCASLTDIYYGGYESDWAAAFSGTLSEQVTVHYRSSGMDVPGTPEILTGECGYSATWTFDEATGLLTISGSGKIFDFGRLTDSQGIETGEWRDSPWKSFLREIKSVRIEEGITYIGNESFKNAVNLAEVYAPAVTSVGKYAFSGASSLKTADIPSLRAIDAYGFDGCKALTALPLPENFSWFKDYAFRNCGFTEFSVPAKVSSLPFLFDGCADLRAVFIPSAVKMIGNTTFWDCTSLTDIYYEGSQEDWAAIVYSAKSPDEYNNATIHYNSTGLYAPGETEDPQILREVRYFLDWEEQTQRAFFGPDGLVDDSCAVSEETDSTFLEDPASYEGLYVLVETKLVEDEEILLSVILPQSNTGTVTACSESSITIDDIIYAIGETVLPENILGEFVLYHIVSNELVGIEILQEKTGYLTYWHKDARMMWIQSDETATDSKDYRLSIWATEDSETFLNEFVPINCATDVTVNYLMDSSRHIFEIAPYVEYRANGFSEDEHGWPLLNNWDSFGYSHDYTFSPWIYYTHGYEVGSIANKLFCDLSANVFQQYWGGNCFGLSLLAVAQYNGQLDLKPYFPNSAGTLNEFGYDSIDQNNGIQIYTLYHYEDGQKVYHPIINKIEQAQASQMSWEIMYANKHCYAYEYQDLIDYLYGNNPRPLLITIQGHTVVTETSKKPIYIGNGCYLIPLYDCNSPQSPEDPHNFYDAYRREQSMLYLDTQNGIWGYWFDGTWKKTGKKETDTDDFLILDTDDLSDSLFFDANYSIDSSQLVVLLELGDGTAPSRFHISKIDSATGELTTMFEIKDSDPIFRNNNVEYRPYVETASDGSKNHKIVVFLPIGNYIIQSEGKSFVQCMYDNDFYSFGSDKGIDARLITKTDELTIIGTQDDTTVSCFHAGLDVDFCTSLESTINTRETVTLSANSETRSASVVTNAPTESITLQHAVDGELIDITPDMIHQHTDLIHNEAVEATCTVSGQAEHYLCPCGMTFTDEDAYEEITDVVIPALGHIGQWAPTGNKEGEEFRICERCGEEEIRMTGNRLIMDSEVLGDHSSVWIDGLIYPVQTENGKAIIQLPEGDAFYMQTYTFHIGDETDVHTQYPTGMQVWKVEKNPEGIFAAERIEEFDNLLQYSGASIRIVGVKGIRMITSITKGNKSALTGEGLAGYTLEEYGTALCWATDLAPGEDLVLGKEYTRSNYAYKKGVADPIFAQTAELIQYTNVLVGFSDDQCIPDIVMRPYIILSDAEGNQVTLYGGSIYRSIGYIAWQNRNVFQPGNASYDYVWGIIHHVYGDQFDEDYKG